MKTKKIVVCAMLIALGTVLSVIQPFALPFGGGITLASMMPICLIAVIYGTKEGLISAFAFSVLQMFLGASTISAAFLPGEDQMVLGKAILMCFLDYTLAYTVLGFSGIFMKKLKNKSAAASLGALFTTALRYLAHIISGYILWGSYAEWFFSQEGFYAFGEKILNAFSGNLLAFIYSVIYNGLYMIPEIIITAAIIPFVYTALKKSKAI